MLWKAYPCHSKLFGSIGPLTKGRSVKNTLWVDAICIDQDSVEEKNHQIPLMGDIYRNAKETLMCLGEGTEETRDIPQRIFWLNARRVVENTDQGEEGSSPISKLIRTLKDLDETEYNALLQPILNGAIDQILSRPYFRRMWTIQEVALSNSLTMVIGNHTLDWSHFTSVVEFDKFMDQLSASPAASHMVAKTVVDVSGGYHGTPRWSDLKRRRGTSVISVLLTSARSHESSDKRDRLYVLHSILELYGAFPQPDYSRTWTEVYTDTAVAVILRDRGSLQFFREGPSRHQAFGLPSWVPNWSEDPGFDSDWVSRPSPVLKETDSVTSNGPRLHTLSILIGHVGETEADTSHLAKELLHRPVATSPAQIPGWVKSRNWSKILDRNLDAWLRHVPQYVFHELCLRVSEADNSHVRSLDDRIWRKLLTTDFEQVVNFSDVFHPRGAAWHIHKPMGCPHKDWEVLGWSLLVAHKILDDRGGLNLLLFWLNTGYLGFSIHNPKAGDLVALLPGVSCPGLLRPHRNEGEYLLVGFVWVFGVMNDEMENLEAFSKTRITIL
ncbi:hypothetical protein N658DRAFT_249603 [Parathielavia hyrcaniae]|uniref:Heterokaryon incompatibility domain-containing protein n=1 Tax=Parathielavia hyrcaniae TaxID=113614 RepID=A0AAN6Q687_9PEZI|nr:hypothetical protein N658DRAFT_249603 [Parathielavia hyrcaniae]